jgi:hypothetical protein
MLGDRLNIYPVKGYSITVHLHTPESQDAAPMVSILDDATKIVTSRLGRDRFRVAGTAEFNGFNRDIRHDRIEPLILWTRQQFPRVVTDRVVAWSGPRRLRQSPRRVLQYRPRPPRLDPFRRDGPVGRSLRGPVLPNASQRSGLRDKSFLVLFFKKELLACCGRKQEVLF